MRGREAAAADERMARRRLRIVLGVLAVLAVLPLQRLVELQLAADDLTEAGVDQRSATVEVPALRGSVLDRNGVELAVSVPRTLVAVDLVALRGVGVADRVGLETFAGRLAGLLGVDAGEVRRALVDADPDARWVRVAERVDVTVAEAAERVLAEEDDVTGVLILEPATERVHPGGPSALRLVGTIGADGPGPRAGIERLYDDVLRGESGQLLVEASRGRTMPGAQQVVDAPDPGADVQLTLDRTLQYEAERLLADGAEAAAAHSGVAIIGRPGTGELLAVAGVERDAATGRMGLATAPLAFSSAFQAGSVFKLVTVAAGYEAGVIDDASSFSVPYRITVTDRSFTDNEPHPTQQMTVDQIVAESSNVGTIKIAQLLGADRLHDELADFGFGRPTGVGSPAENPGALPAVDDWVPADTAAASIGTFQSATPVQLWSAYNVIANGGRYVAPRLVDAVVEPDGSRRPVPVGAGRQVVSEQTSARVQRSLRAVVEEGTGKRWDLPGFPVAAKTGTGRMPSPERVDPKDSYIWPDGRYHYVTTFTGYLPADRPEVSITVMLIDTPPGSTGGGVAGPVFADLARLSVRELGVVPTEGAAAAAAAGTGGPVRAAPAAARASTGDPAGSATMAGTAGAPAARPRTTGGSGGNGQRLDDGG